MMLAVRQKNDQQDISNDNKNREHIKTFRERLETLQVASRLLERTRTAIKRLFAGVGQLGWME